MNDYLVKPFGAADLAQIAAQLVPATAPEGQRNQNKFSLSLVERQVWATTVFWFNC
jgi:hypothetical protein